MRIVLLLVGMLVGSVATRHASSSPPEHTCIVREAEPRIVTVERPVVREVIVEREVETVEGEEVEEEGDPIDMTRVFERVAAAIVPSGIHGRVLDASTGEPLPGATIVASDGQRSYTAIAVEDGGYDIALPAGRYTVTIYYADHVVDYPGIDVASDRRSLLYGRVLGGVSFSGTMSIDNVYIVE